MQGMHRVKLKISGITGTFLIIIFAVHFLLIEPGHHHEDELFHDDCAICLSANMPLDITGNFTFYCVSVLLPERFICFSYKFQSTVIFHHKSRSPPYIKVS
jgi:hypothetical protein